jgi:hypothetical protein
MDGFFPRRHHEIAFLVIFVLFFVLHREWC